MEKRRPKENRSKLLEYFPNEIFGQIFSYLNGVDAVFAFSNLNHRFQCLLYEYCWSFNFHSISRRQFDVILQQHDTNRWKSLRISDDNQTPDHLEYFCHCYSLENGFPRLKSLSLFNLNVEKKYRIFSQLPSLTNLVSLTIESMCGENMSPFSLPNLKRLVFSSCADITWIQNFSQVENIEYTIDKCYYHQKEFIWPLTLKYLKIVFSTEAHHNLILRSLVSLLSLVSLEIYQKTSGFFRPDGQSWENLVRSSFPLLKTLKLFFQFEYLQSVADHDAVIASFATPFYIRERNWFIYYDIYRRYAHHLIILNSLPFAFERFITSKYAFENSISTLSKDNNDFYASLYQNIKTLQINHGTAEPSENFNEPSVVHLIIYVDFDFITWLHVLTNLRHLDIQSGTVISSKGFHRLLSNTPHLSVLGVKKTLLRRLTENWSHVAVCNYLSEKIYSLKIYPVMRHSHCCSKNELQQIVRIFGSKCQHLSLTVEVPNNTIDFILQNMSQLRSCHVEVTGKNYEPINMVWLEKQQTKFNHSNCIIVNNKNSYHFWL